MAETHEQAIKRLKGWIRLYRREHKKGWPNCQPRERILQERLWKITNDELAIHQQAVADWKKKK